MAKINIETSLLIDPRFEQLVNQFIEEKHPDPKYVALGLLNTVWFLAFQHSENESPSVPVNIFERIKYWEKLIQFDFARKTENGYYLSGTKDQFQWKRKLRERDKARKEKWKLKHKKNVERFGTDGNGRERNTSTSTSTSTSSSITIKNKENTNTGERASKIESPPDFESPTKLFLASYAEAFKKRYRTNPVINGKAAGIAKRLVEGKNSIPVEKAKKLIEEYLSMNDAWFLTKRHDLATFESNLNSVHVKNETGEGMSARDARDAERKHSNFDVINAYSKKLGALKNEPA